VQIVGGINLSRELKGLNPNQVLKEPLTPRLEAVAMSNLKFIIIFLVLSAFTSSPFVLRTYASSQVVAASAVSRAEEVLTSAYEAVLEAEGAGANVSALVARLSEAGDLLAQAQVSNRLGDFVGTARLADLCGEIGEEVRIKALELRDLAVEEAGQRFRWTIIGSIVGVVAILCLSFLGWHIFKLRYYRRILEMKPEVVSDES